MIQLEKVSSLDKGLWRRIESHLARKDFLESVNDLGLIALILKRYVHLPHALRELAIEEVFEKAELQINTIFDRMLSQKKLAEDVGFDAHDFSTLIETFSSVLFGSDSFYSKTNEVFVRFKYAIGPNEVVTLLAAFIQADKKPDKLLSESLQGIQGSDLSSEELRHKL